MGLSSAQGRSASSTLSSSFSRACAGFEIVCVNKVFPPMDGVRQLTHSGLRQLSKVPNESNHPWSIRFPDANCSTAEAVQRAVPVRF